MVMELNVAKIEQLLLQVRWFHLVRWYWDEVYKTLLQYCIRGREKTSDFISEIACGIFSPHSKECFSLMDMWLRLSWEHSFVVIVHLWSQCEIYCGAARVGMEAELCLAEIITPAR